MNMKTYISFHNRWILCHKGLCLLWRRPVLDSYVMCVGDQTTITCKTIKPVNKINTFHPHTGCGNAYSEVSFPILFIFLYITEREQVLARIGEKSTLLNNVLGRKSNWSGHIMRRNCLLHDATEEEMKEVKGVGKRRTQLLDDLRKRRRYWELKEGADDRNR